MSEDNKYEPTMEYILEQKLDEAREDIGTMQGQIDTLTEDANLMREFKAAIRGMSGLRISYEHPKQNVGRGLITDTELHIIDRILTRISTEANQDI